MKRYSHITTKITGPSVPIFKRARLGGVRKTPRLLPQDTDFEAKEKRTIPKPEIVVIYTDGACKGNNQKNEALRKAGYGVWFGDNDERNIYGRLPGTQANGAAELYAIHEALRLYVNSGDSVEIRTDATYAKDVITKWMHGWAKKGWRTATGQPIKNSEIVKQIYAMRNRMGDRFTFTWVKGHSGIHGNEMADSLANMGCEQEKPSNFSWVTPTKNARNVGPQFPLP